MKDLEKLRVLLSHWIEHNKAHADEFRRWANKAGTAASDVQEAVQRMADVNQALTAALEKLGGAVEYDHTEHRHTHDH